MARIAGVDIPNAKARRDCSDLYLRILAESSSNDILARTGIDPDKSKGSD